VPPLRAPFRAGGLDMLFGPVPAAIIPVDA
jgi:hypothetical protein